MAELIIVIQQFRSANFSGGGLFPAFFLAVEYSLNRVKFGRT